MRIDHLAVVAADLDEGVRWLGGMLGLTPEPAIGRHARFGTCNRLLSLGPDLYLEVIAPDPAAPAPGRPRWFDLDHARRPRLGNWIVRVPAPEDIPTAAGERLALARDDLTWEIGVPADGSLPAGGALPTLIAWKTGLHPAARLPDVGARLVSLTVCHPQAEAFAADILPQIADPRLRYAVAEEPGLRAEIMTPAGLRHL